MELLFIFFSKVMENFYISKALVMKVAKALVMRKLNLNLGIKNTNIDSDFLKYLLELSKKVDYG